MSNPANSISVSVVKSPRAVKAAIPSKAKASLKLQNTNLSEIKLMIIVVDVISMSLSAAIYIINETAK
jgi:hypothetical protein